jgi:hypothetical protein
VLVERFFGGIRQQQQQRYRQRSDIDRGKLRFRHGDDRRDCIGKHQPVRFRVGYCELRGERSRGRYR